MPRFIAGVRAIIARRTASPYPASIPLIRPALVSQSPKPETLGVSSHHSATTARAPSAMRPSTVRGWLRAGCGLGDGGGTTARGAGRTRWSVHVAISAPQVPGTAVSPPSLGSPAADDIVGTLLLYKLCSGYPRPWNSREEEHGRGTARGSDGRQAVGSSARGVARASRWSVVTRRACSRAGYAQGVPSSRSIPTTC